MQSDKQYPVPLLVEDLALILSPIVGISANTVRIQLLETHLLDNAISSMFCSPRMRDCSEDIFFSFSSLILLYVEILKSFYVVNGLLLHSMHHKAVCVGVCIKSKFI